MAKRLNQLCRKTFAVIFTVFPWFFFFIVTLSTLNTLPAPHERPKTGYKCKGRRIFEEVIAVSYDGDKTNKLAVFDGQKSIRGGIPIVFPHFGSWAFGPQHGFARTSRWNVEKQPEPLENGDIEALFSLVDNPITKQMWNYSFKLLLRVILREKELQVSFNLYNTSIEPFQFNMLFHTYLKVPDVRKCSISGLQGCMYVDKTKENGVYQEPREMVTVNHWTDRIYQNTQQEHIISNVVSGRKMKMIKYNMPDTVVWNPWDVTSNTMNDFGDDEYPNMVCVEAGMVITPITLNPNNTYEGTMVLQVM